MREHIAGTEPDDCGCNEYNELSRREFLSRAAGVSGAAAAAAIFPDWLPRIVMAESHASDRDVIVSVFMRGGVDGLTLCAPFSDPLYYSGRSTIAIPHPDSSATATRGIALDDDFALPRGMAGLLPAYMEQDLLFVHGSGQKNTVSRSHFDAQRFMEVGKPADPTIGTGWLARHIASVPPMREGSLLRGIGLATGLQKTLVGAPRTLPISDPANFSIGGSVLSRNERLAVLQGDYAAADGQLSTAALDAVNTVALLASVDFAGYVPANGAVYPNTAFGRGLRAVAVLIKADVGIEAAQVDIGGWDTHAQQNPLSGSMYFTMQNFSNALAAFHADVMAPRSHPVTLVAMSEFGRNVRENGSGGTDHGRASTMLLMGGGIAGGRVLTRFWPGLAPDVLDNGRDLPVTIDYRDILSEVVSYRLGNPNLDYVFPGRVPEMLGVTL